MTKRSRFAHASARLGAVALCAVGLSSPALADDGSPSPQSERTHVVEPPTSPSLGAVLREVPRDLWRFLSVDTAVVLGVGGGAALIAHVWDDDLVQEIQESPQLNDAFAPGSKYGAFAVMLGGSFAVYGLGRAFDGPHVAVVGADLVRSQIVSQVWVQVLKITVQRERPDGSDNLSFPSGHAAGGFAAAAVLSRHYGWKAAIPAYTGAVYIAAARIHDNKHYLSDVTFGAAIGLAGARTVTLKAGRYGFQAAPVLVPGGAALHVTLLPVRP